ncbi:MAG: hypothetical protein M0033_11285 [Nitrospiraceae bacterium]|nr:hypothetical protein [Nitrospiraceae bacterium]
MVPVVEPLAGDMGWGGVKVVEDPDGPVVSVAPDGPDAPLEEVEAVPWPVDETVVVWLPEGFEVMPPSVVVPPPVLGPVQSSQQRLMVTLLQLFILSTTLPRPGAVLKQAVAHPRKTDHRGVAAR